jgi:lipoprotein signal peptidase
MSLLSAVDPLALSALIVALLGVVPLVVHYRRRSKWFVVAYGFIVVGAVSTNAEDFLLGGAFNFLEHGVGLMAASIAFALAAYHRRNDVLLAGDAAGGEK